MSRLIKFTLLTILVAGCNAAPVTVPDECASVLAADDYAAGVAFVRSRQAAGINRPAVVIELTATCTDHPDPDACASCLTAMVSEVY